MTTLIDILRDFFTGKEFEKAIKMIFSKEILFYALVIAIIIISVIGVYRYTKKKLCEKVMKNSNRFKMLCEINSRYHFFDELEEEYTFSEEIENRQKYNRFNFDVFFEQTIELNLESIKKIIVQVKENRRLLEKYEEELASINHISEKEDARECRLPIWLFSRIEEKILNEEKLKPVVAPIFIGEVSYETPQGRCYYEMDKEYSFKEMKHHYKRVIQKIEDREKREYQRKIMTDSLRYDIMKRDRFKCVLCGSSASDGAVLHVDHIIPVSKGGKTVESNLRTLCKSCNMGKRDKYDENGDN